MSDRIKRLERAALERGEIGAASDFLRDLHSSALGRFSDLPHGRKLALAMAYAIENLPVYAYDDDGIGGRVYHNRDNPPEA